MAKLFNNRRIPSIPILLSLGVAVAPVVSCRSFEWKNDRPGHDLAHQNPYCEQPLDPDGIAALLDDSFTTDGSTRALLEAIGSYYRVAQDSYSDIVTLCRRIRHFAQPGSFDGGANEEDCIVAFRQLHADMETDVVDGVDRTWPDEPVKIRATLVKPVGCVSGTSDLTECLTMCQKHDECNVVSRNLDCSGGTAVTSCGGSCSPSGLPTVTCDGFCMGQCIGSCKADPVCFGYCDGDCSSNDDNHPGVVPGRLCDGYCDDMCWFVDNSSRCDGGLCHGLCNGECHSSLGAPFLCNGYCSGPDQFVGCYNSGEIRPDCEFDSVCARACQVFNWTKAVCNVAKVYVRFSGPTIMPEENYEQALKELEYDLERFFLVAARMGVVGGAFERSNIEASTVLNSNYLSAQCMSRIVVSISQANSVYSSVMEWIGAFNDLPIAKR